MFNEDIKFQLPRHGQCSFIPLIIAMAASAAAGAAARSSARQGLAEAGDVYDQYGNLISEEIMRGYTKSKDTIRAQYAKAIGQFEPYRQFGTNLLDRYGETMTPGSKWYQWRTKEGEKGVNRYLASRGLHGSGEAATEAFQRMGTQLSAEEEQAVFDRLAGGVNLGYNATGATTGLITGKADRVAGIYNNRATSYSNLYSWLADRRAKLAGDAGMVNAGFYSGLGQMAMQAGSMAGGMYGGGGGVATSGVAGGGTPSSLTPNSLYNYRR